MAGRAIFLVSLSATLFCAAVNAYTLQIAYPLWRTVDAAGFRAMHAAYLQRLWPVITLPHVVMFFASAALLWRRPAALSMAESIAVFLLNAGVVVLSAFVAGPVHSRFEVTGMLDMPGYRTLIAVSVLRVAMTIVSSALLLLVVWRSLRAAG